jgi:TRAP-type mannitol/chloroaromatic compound transport system permease large subunit
MNFEELYEKYKAGTASVEERAAVLREIEAARRVSALLEEDRGMGEKIAPVDRETVKKAKKAFDLRTTVRTVVICAICVAVLAVLVCGAIFGTAIVSAHKARNLTEEQAIDAAKALLATHAEGSAITDMIVSSVESELDIQIKLTDTVYVYEIELLLGDYRYQVDVSAKTGYAVLSDKEPLREEKDEHEFDRKNTETHKSARAGKELAWAN